MQLQLDPDISSKLIEAEQCLPTDLDRAEQLYTEIISQENLPTGNLDNTCLGTIFALENRARIFVHQERIDDARRDLEQVLCVTEEFHEVHSREDLARLNKRSESAQLLGLLFQYKLHDPAKALSAYNVGLATREAELEAITRLGESFVSHDFYVDLQVGYGGLFQGSAEMLFALGSYKSAIVASSSGISYIQEIWRTEVPVMDPSMAEFSPLRSHPILQNAMRQLHLCRGVSRLQLDEPERDLQEAYDDFTTASGFLGHFNAAQICVERDDSTGAERHYAVALSQFSDDAPNKVALSSTVEALAYIRGQEMEFVMAEYGIDLSIQN